MKRLCEAAFVGAGPSMARLPHIEPLADAAIRTILR